MAFFWQGALLLSLAAAVSVHAGTLLHLKKKKCFNNLLLKLFTSTNVLLYPVQT